MREISKALLSTGVKLPEKRIHASIQLPRLRQDFLPAFNKLPSMGARPGRYHYELRVKAMQTFYA